MKFLQNRNTTDSSHDTFKYLFYNRVRYYASACGSDVTNPAYRYSLRTYIFVASTVLFIFFSAYTIYAYEDPRDKVKCLITFPFGLQVSEKLEKYLHLTEKKKKTQTFSISHKRVS